MHLQLVFKEMSTILYFLGNVDWRQSGYGQTYMDIIIINIVLWRPFQENYADYDYYDYGIINGIFDWILQILSYLGLPPDYHLVLGTRGLGIDNFSLYIYWLLSTDCCMVNYKRNETQSSLLASSLYGGNTIKWCLLHL